MHAGNVAPEALIESIDHEGIGVAHVEGKVTFIDGGVVNAAGDGSLGAPGGSVEIATGRLNFTDAADER